MNRPLQVIRGENDDVKWTILVYPEYTHGVFTPKDTPRGNDLRKEWGG